MSSVSCFQCARWAKTERLLQTEFQRTFQPRDPFDHPFIQGLTEFMLSDLSFERPPAPGELERHAWALTRKCPHLEDG